MGKFPEAKYAPIHSAGEKDGLYSFSIALKNSDDVQEALEYCNNCPVSKLPKRVPAQECSGIRKELATAILTMVDQSQIASALCGVSGIPIEKKP